MTHDFKRFPELANSQMEMYYWDSPHKQIVDDFNAEVVRVIDGDTIRVKWIERDFVFPVRLLNINAAEIDEGGLASKKWLESQILNQEVTIIINQKQRVGKFGRLLGIITHLGRNINQLSIESGYSVPFGSEEVI